MTRKANKKLPPSSRLFELFTYDPSTGRLKWNTKNSNRAIKGSIAGCKTPEGYIVVGVDGQLYMAHRIIWKMLYNEEPEEIDHINLIKDDNRKVNLRKSDCVTNQHNHKIQSRNKQVLKVCVLKQINTILCIILLKSVAKVYDIVKHFRSQMMENGMLCNG